MEENRGRRSPFFMALTMSRSSSLAWLFWGSVCSSPRTYFRAFSYSYTHTPLSISALLLPIRRAFPSLALGAPPSTSNPSLTLAPPNGVESTNSPNCVG